ncbi:MAG: Uma2 family endonuclease [Chloroflexi bacterium]|nr:Uma2 family endonuclease [Chloroflexota bacterium]
MTTARTKAPSAPLADDVVEEVPWYELINDSPEPPEDAMQQASIIHYVMAILRARYKNDPTTLWSNQTNVIYDSEVPGSVIVPDGYIVFGVDARTIETERRSYRIDEWGVAPAFVLEVASESTAHRDLGEKRELYARMRAQEYWRLDRHGFYGEPLVGERLVDGEYVRFPLHTDANGDEWSRSEVLGVDFCHRVEDGISWFLLRDSATGEWLADLSEEIEAHADTEAARLAEREARLAAEARNRELEAELERLHRQSNA